MSRLSQLNQWLESIEENTFTDVQAASSDASFRQYFRVWHQGDNKHYIVMDAPPDKEDCHPFVHVTERLRQHDVHAPEILACNLTQGFLLLEDLGEQPYLSVLDEQTADTLYGAALDALIKMQRIEALLPLYNSDLLTSEMQLFETWYLKRHLNIQLNADSRATLSAQFKLLVDNALEQPQVFVHRDYHSRNLMVTQQNSPGVIDYQDAVKGPITYDLVSLFKDCYIEWPRERVISWLEAYLQRLNGTYSLSLPQLLRWFDLTGLQRHLKVLGIFARLNYRDGKAQYLADLPLTLKYVTDVCQRYDELKPLADLLDNLLHEAIAG